MQNLMLQRKRNIFMTNFTIEEKDDEQTRKMSHVAVFIATNSRLVVLVGEYYKDLYFYCTQSIYL